MFGLEGGKKKEKQKSKSINLSNARLGEAINTFHQRGKTWFLLIVKKKNLLYIYINVHKILKRMFFLSAYLSFSHTCSLSHRPTHASPFSLSSVILFPFFPRFPFPKFSFFFLFLSLSHTHTHPTNARVFSGKKEKKKKMNQGIGRMKSLLTDSLHSVVSCDAIL